MSDHIIVVSAEQLARLEAEEPEPTPALLELTSAVRPVVVRELPAHGMGWPA